MRVASSLASRKAALASPAPREGVKRIDLLIAQGLANSRDPGRLLDLLPFVALRVAKEAEFGEADEQRGSQADQQRSMALEKRVPEGLQFRRPALGDRFQLLMLPYQQDSSAKAQTASNAKAPATSMFLRRSASGVGSFCPVD